MGKGELQHSQAGHGEHISSSGSTDSKHACKGSGQKTNPSAFSLAEEMGVFSKGWHKMNAGLSHSRQQKAGNQIREGTTGAASFIMSVDLSPVAGGPEAAQAVWSTCVPGLML